MGAIVLFDGLCNFCDGSVNFIIRHDRAGYFSFAPLQSEAGRKILSDNGLRASEGGPESIVLVEDGKAHTHSEAAIRIARHLDGLWKAFYAAIVIPRSIRDYFYRSFAKRRYQLFGKKNECSIPSAEVRSRFLTI
jgi:predicted DCC family thiol-disulfide oxidoreductase YuxK